MSETTQTDAPDVPVNVTALIAELEAEATRWASELLRNPSICKTTEFVCLSQSGAYTDAALRVKRAFGLIPPEDADVPVPADRQEQACSPVYTEFVEWLERRGVRMTPRQSVFAKLIFGTGSFLASPDIAIGKTLFIEWLSKFDRCGMLNRAAKMPCYQPLRKS